MVSKSTDTPRLTPRFDEALVYASRLHRKQIRKGTSVPYVAHLLAVAALVLEDGGDEDEAVAALLHDAVEDQGGAARLADIGLRFGDRVARIVAGCSDADTVPKPPWRARKERYVEHLRGAPSDVRRVSLADKFHNARSIVAGLRVHDDALWDRFSGGMDGTLWYYHALVLAFQETGGGLMVDELRRLVEEMERLATGNAGCTGESALSSQFD